MDTQTKQQIWYHDQIPKEDRVPMTPEICFDFCANVTGVQFFGLKRGTQCYCSPFFHNTDKGGNGECDTPCEGDTSQTCGGVNMQDIYEMHDCNNLPPLPCKKPPQMVPFAVQHKSRYYRKTMVPCSNTATNPLTTANSLCHVECIPGYNLAKNSLKCKEKGDRLTYAWAQLVGEAHCTPVNCGVPPDTLHSRHPGMAVVFPLKSTYTCQLGYEMAKKVDGNHLVLDNTQCKEDAKFDIEPPCQPVPCGECQTGEEKFPYATPREAGIRVFKQACTYDCAKGYTLDRQAQGQKVYTITCMATKQYQEAPKCKPVLCGPARDHPHASMKKPEDPDTALVFPQTATYNCKEGYTLTGIVGGEIEYSVSCKANALFSKPPECKPVTCGPPALVPNSIFAPATLYYTDAVSYSCNPGYTLSGEAGTRNTKTLFCGADGQFDSATPTCKPVRCGKPPSFDNTKLQTQGVDMMDFAKEPLSYKCEPGYSTAVDDDPWNPAANEYALTCKTDGTLTYAPPCVNINDCTVRKCGDFGGCVDLDKPTGVPLDDFTCNCNAGYEITLYPSAQEEGEMSKHCTNINDCPTGDDVCGGDTKDGVRRGKCMDGLMTYTCVPGGGYAVTRVPGKPKNQTCSPVICGTPATVAHGKTDTSGEQTYDSPKFTYTCDTGYTVDRPRGRNPSKCSAITTRPFGAWSNVTPWTVGSHPQLIFRTETQSRLACSSQMSLLTHVRRATRPAQKLRAPSSSMWSAWLPASSKVQ
jgi:hypothetical protein